MDLKYQIEYIHRIYAVSYGESMIKRHANTFIYGFAIFSMFFGSGNLVFPLEIGRNTHQYWLLGFAGLFVSGILLPFLGLFAIKLHRGNYNAFFQEAGSLAGFVLPLFTLSLLGSFGVVPRCITVAHGGMEYIIPGLSLGVFSFIFCIICFVTCIKEHFMIAVLGKWMTPLLLVSLIILICVAVISAPELKQNGLTHLSAFKNGLETGYQTMDLFGAFFFSALIFNQIQAKLQATHDKDIIRAALKPSIVGSVLLGLIYLGFVFLGAHYKAVIADVSPELFLPTIAKELMGDNAVLLIAIIVLFSCLTTAVALNNIYAHYLCGLFKIKKDQFIYVLIVTTLVSFIVSLIDFQGIAAVLGPILEVTYPSMIVLTVLSIFLKDHKKMKIFLFYTTLLATLFWTIFGNTLI